MDRVQMDRIQQDSPLYDDALRAGFAAEKKREAALRITTKEGEIIQLFQIAGTNTIQDTLMKCGGAPVCPRCYAENSDDEMSCIVNGTPPNLVCTKCDHDLRAQVNTRKGLETCRQMRELRLKWLHISSPKRGCSTFRHCCPNRRCKNTSDDTMVRNPEGELVCLLCATVVERVPFRVHGEFRKFHEDGTLETGTTQYGSPSTPLYTPGHMYGYLKTEQMEQQIDTVRNKAYEMISQGCDQLSLASPVGPMAKGLVASWRLKPHKTSKIEEYVATAMVISLRVVSQQAAILDTRPLDRRRRQTCRQRQRSRSLSAELAVNSPTASHTCPHPKEWDPAQFKSHFSSETVMKEAAKELKLSDQCYLDEVNGMCQLLLTRSSQKKHTFGQCIASCTQRNLAIPGTKHPQIARFACKQIARAKHSNLQGKRKVQIQQSSRKRLLASSRTWMAVVKSGGSIGSSTPPTTHTPSHGDPTPQIHVENVTSLSCTLSCSSSTVSLSDSSAGSTSSASLDGVPSHLSSSSLSSSSSSGSSSSGSAGDSSADLPDDLKGLFFPY